MMASIDGDRREGIEALLRQARNLVDGINARMEEIQTLLEEPDDDDA